MLEQRLGKVGYYMGTVVAVSVALFLILLPVGAVVTGSMIVAERLYGPVQTSVALRFLYWIVWIALVITCVLILHSAWRAKKRSQKLLDRTEELLEAIREES